jgi:hypothetical protein
VWGSVYEVTWLFAGKHLAIDIQPGNFFLPKDTRTPIICVGPGTGVAPMRAVLQQRIRCGAVGTAQLTPLFHKFLFFDKITHYILDADQRPKISTTRRNGCNTNEMVPFVTILLFLVMVTTG